MKQSLTSWVLPLLVVLLSLEASAREFTDVQGRKLEGELLSVTGDKATIKRADDDKVFTVSVSQFSPEDQKYMKDLGAMQAKYIFDVKLVKDKLRTSKTKEGNVTVEAERWAYNIGVTNKTSLDAENLRVDYWLFVKADDGKIKSGPKIQKAGEAVIGTLKRSAVSQFQTLPLLLSKQTLDGDFYYADGTKNKARDTVGGVALRFFIGAQEVFAWATDPTLLKMATGRAANSPAYDKIR